VPRLALSVENQEGEIEGGRDREGAREGAPLLLPYATLQCPVPPLSLPVYRSCRDGAIVRRISGEPTNVQHAAGRGASAPSCAVGRVRQAPLGLPFVEASHGCRR